MPTSFAVTWDYRCPFARIAHQHVLAGLDAGADWDVHFVPFSLSQVHVEPGGLDVWDDPARVADLVAIEAGLVVRDRMPEAFTAVHGALFEARHRQGRDLRQQPEIADVIGAHVDADAVLHEIDAGWPRETFRKEHESSASEHAVWGVPTFIAGRSAAFVRLMSGPKDSADAVRTVERVVDTLTGWPELNEFKHTSIDR